jgi:hypothetical protein
MGKNTFVSAAAFAAPAPAINDNADGWVPGINVTAGQTYLLYVDDHHLSGNSYTVNWTVAPANVIDCVILPVQELALEADPKTSAVDLTWSTTSEQNSSHFLVQRSADGRDYSPIGSVGAMGTIASRTEYRFTDDSPYMGLNYYRLQQVDLDGEFVFSNVVTALFKPDDVKVLIVPNPARTRAEVVLNAAYDGTLHVRIMDGSGRIVRTFQTASGVQRFDLPIDLFEPGSYSVELTTEKGGPFARTRFVKQ